MKMMIMNDQGGSRIDICEDIIPTLRAQDHGHPPVLCYAVDCRNLEVTEDLSGTLQAKNVGGYSYNYLNPVLYEDEGDVECYAIENHPNDSRITLCTDGIVQTLSSRMGTVGNNTPFVLIVQK